MTPNEIKPKLWKESLRCFSRHWRPWMKLAVWFVVILAALNLLVQPDTETLRLMQEAKNSAAGSLSPALKAKMGLFGLVTLVITVIQYYLFNMFFLTREQVLAKPLKPSASGFWYYFGQRLLSVVLSILPAVAGGLVAGLSSAAVQGTGGAVGAGGGIAMAAIAFGTFLVSFYMSLKYSLVGVLACARIRSTLKASWALTENNWWRLLGNGMMLSFLALLVYSPIALAAQLVAALVPVLSPLLVLVNAAFVAVFGGVLSAFGCTAFRILYQERRQTDPAFALAGKE